MAERIKIKARPVKQHIKIQYEGEELTIKELVDRLEKFRFLFGFWKEEADKSSKMVDELMKQLADVQPVRYGKWITVVETNGKEHSKCSDCQMELDGLKDAYSYCAHCGAKMDDKDINVPTKSGMEEEDDG